MENGFARRKEHSKEEIRKAAWELFSQYGVEKVSIVEIARKANVSQATIYNNFGSKDALVKEFVSFVVDQLVTRVEEIFLSEQDFWGKLEACFTFISGMMAQGPALSYETAVFGIRLDLINDPEIQKIREAAQEKMTWLLIRLVQEGKEQGQIRNDISETAFLFYLRAFIDIFPGPQFRMQYANNPDLVHELGSLMISGLKGGRK
jgi:AcrR family transcriptional regulator